MKTNVVKVTPEMAEKWLEKNVKNRHLTQTSIVRFSEMIERGEWLLNGESIKFNRDGDLIDGQHRLHAIIRAGKAVDTVVDTDLDNNVFVTLDTGRKRAASDSLSIVGYDNPVGLASTIRVFLVNRKGKLFTDNGRAYISNKEINDFAANNPAIIALMHIGMQSQIVNKLMTRSLAGGLYPIFYRSSPDKTQKFYTIMENGSTDSVSHDNAVSVLRNKLTMGINSGSSSGGRQAKLACYVVHAWNAFVDDRQISILRAPSGTEIKIK